MFYGSFPAAAVLLWPSDGQPALFRQLSVDIPAELILFFGQLAEDFLFFNRHFNFQKFSELLSEPVLFCSEIEVHCSAC